MRSAEKPKLNPSLMRVLGHSPATRSCAALLAIALLSACSPLSLAGLNARSPASAPAEVSVGAFLSGPAGALMDGPDRANAAKAQIDALESGKRISWRAAHSDAYGYVDPAAPSAFSGRECRSFTHTLYSAGRPQRGTGQGCRDARGNWEIVS